MSEAFSPGSAEWTKGSDGLGFDTSSSLSRILTAVPCSPPAGPEPPSTTTYETWGATFTGNDWSLERELSPPMRAGADRQNTMPLTFSAAAPMKYQPLKKLTGEQVGQSIWLYREGLSLSEVAAVMSVSRQAMHDLLKRRIPLRDRVDALPRKEQTAVRRKRARTRQRYRDRAARITREQIRRVTERDQVCRQCGAEGSQIDHVIPVALGGQTELWNLQLLCGPCHTAKSRCDRQMVREGVTPSEAFRRSIFSAEASRDRARTSQSPETAPDSQATDPASSMSSPASQTLFDPDGYSSRTFLVSSLAKAVGTSEQSLERWPTSGTAWRGGFSTHVTSECRSDADACSSSEPSLTQILEPPLNVPAKYSLSGRAATGILRRAEKRGRTLPSHLSAALETVARTTTTDRQDGSSPEHSADGVARDPKKRQATG